MATHVPSGMRIALKRIRHVSASAMMQATARSWLYAACCPLHVASSVLHGARCSVLSKVKRDELMCELDALTSAMSASRDAEWALVSTTCNTGYAKR